MSNSHDQPADVTRLLAQVRGGDDAAVAQVLSIVYKELRRIAAAMMKRERMDHTLQPTAVVHEAYLRMVDSKGLHFENRAHFFAIAARAMRRVLVDHARRRLAGKRGGESNTEVELSEDIGLTPAQSEELLAVNEALDWLEGLDARRARIVEMHYFSGNTVPEIAAAVGISARTVQRELEAGRLFLKHRLQRKGHTRTR
jgi:RNA polymerase sigma factor (TIGR02999 family)